MTNHPWQDISLADYENHMSLDNIQQLQMLNFIMRVQFRMPASDIMILGVGAGNGLEHVHRYRDSERFEKIYGVDINADYLQKAQERYPKIAKILECICLDLTTEYQKLPAADYLIANLIIEYIGYEVFQKILQTVSPLVVSCVIQVNENEEFISDSPYLPVFERLNEIYQDIDRAKLDKLMEKINYHLIDEEEYPLPNGKKLLCLQYWLMEEAEEED